MAAAGGHVPSQPRLFPSVSLGDGQWDRVLRALQGSMTKADQQVADRIYRQVQECRRRCVERRAAAPSPETEGGER